MKLLALDTATDACTAALMVDQDIEERFVLTKSGHSQQLLTMVEQLLRHADLPLANLDAIAFGRGPGSFTGVRIATGVTQGLAFAADLPVVPISSLAILAQGVKASHIAAAFDARMGQVYCATYCRDTTGTVSLHGQEQVIVPQAFVVADADSWTGAGSGWDVYAETILATNPGRISGWQPGCYPHARDLAVLAVKAYQSGNSVVAADAFPVYLRDNVANKPG